MTCGFRPAYADYFVLALLNPKLITALDVVGNDECANDHIPDRFITRVLDDFVDPDLSPVGRRIINKYLMYGIVVMLLYQHPSGHVDGLPTMFLTSLLALKAGSAPLGPQAQAKRDDSGSRRTDRSGHIDPGHL